MTADVLIVGGGLAGSAAAIELARAGRNVTLVERDAGPAHKVCGEFLSAEALRALEGLGVGVSGLGAVAITTARIAGIRWQAESALPFAAMSLTRQTLDSELLKMAEKMGVAIRRGENVEGLQREGDAWAARLPSGAVLRSRVVLLATGKHDLRGHARPGGKQGDLVAFKMYWQLSAAQREAINHSVELMLFRGGYAGMQPVEGGRANLCCVIRKDTLRSLGGRWEQVLAHMQTECELLRERLSGALPKLARPLALSAIPYGYVRTAAEPGLWALGDQAAVIPSFTGDGMSIALHSGWLAARMLLADRSSAEFQNALCARVRRQVRLATMLSQSMVTPAGQTAAGILFRAWPGMLRAVAQRTRVDDRQTF